MSDGGGGPAPGSRPAEASAEPREEIARLQAELAAAQRTVDVLVRRLERENASSPPDRRAFLRAIGQLETTVAARQRDLAEREQYFRALFHQSPDAILALDRQGAVLSCNRTAAVAFGAAIVDLIGRPVDRLFAPESGAALTGLLWSGFTGVGDAELEVPPDRRMGFSVARLAGGEVLLVLRDVTQRRRLEEALERARRHAGYGRLAAELAVEITNPLSVVLGRLELMLQRPPSRQDQLVPILEVLADHCRSIDATVGNLRALGQPRPPRPRRLPLADLVARAVAHGSTALRRVRLDVDLADGAWVHVDADHGELALRNLMALVAEGMPRDRRLELRSHRVAGDGVELRLRGEDVRLPPQVMEALRQPAPDPMAPVDPGVGLGLAIAWVLLSENGGRLRVVDEAGGPWELAIWLPAGAADLERAAAVPSVLVVDDDQLLCETVSWMLSGRGMSVRTTRTAEEALRILGVESFDCVLVDLILPGMDGIAFVDQVVQRWPHMADRLVLTTGTDQPAPPTVRMLRKPFDRARLLAALAARGES